MWKEKKWSLVPTESLEYNEHEKIGIRFASSQWIRFIILRSEVCLPIKTWEIESFRENCERNYMLDFQVLRNKMLYACFAILTKNERKIHCIEKQTQTFEKWKSDFLSSYATLHNTHHPLSSPRHRDIDWETDRQSWKACEEDKLVLFFGAIVEGDMSYAWANQHQPHIHK